MFGLLALFWFCGWNLLRFIKYNNSAFWFFNMLMDMLLVFAFVFLGSLQGYERE
jgi:hypothetical protein